MLITDHLRILLDDVFIFLAMAMTLYMIRVDFVPAWIEWTRYQRHLLCELVVPHVLWAVWMPWQVLWYMVRSSHTDMNTI